MTANTQKINVKSVAKYMLLPGIVPRAKELGGSGFGYLAFLFACIYRSVRILPANHPYTNPDNIGKFGLISVLSAAANNLEFTRKNIDKIAVFIVLLFGLVLMVLQFALFLLAVFSGQAFAADGAFKSMFVTENPQTDIAFMMLDYVFGLPSAAGGGSFFGSNALSGGPTPFHEGLHALINFYNLAILLVGVLIFLYYVVVVVIETAQTGVPFGKRFAKLYAPFRLIIAVGLLVPLNYGFNGAQYITLYAAKLGSSFATNGWILYNRSIAENGKGGSGAGSNNPLGTPTTALLGNPRGPAIDQIIYFSSIYHACREIYDIYVPKDPQNPKIGTCIKAYVIGKNGSARVFADNQAPSCNSGKTGGPSNNVETYSYQQAKEDFGNSDMEVVLGELDTNQWKDNGGVHPFCGRLTISLNNNNPSVYANTSAGSEHAASAPSGINSVEEAYFGTVRQLLSDKDGSLSALGERIAHSYVPYDSKAGWDPCWKSDKLKDGSSCKNSDPPSSAIADQMRTYQDAVAAQLRAAYDNLASGLNLAVDDNLMKRGWGGAGIWYNNIADINGTYTSAVYSTPSIKNFPLVMEEVKDEAQAQNKQPADICYLFDPSLADQKSANWKNNTAYGVANVLHRAYVYLCTNAGQQTGDSKKVAPADTGTINTMAPACGGAGESVTADTSDAYSSKGNTGNPVLDTMGLVFGVNGLFDLRKASCIDNGTQQAKVHPLAQLSTLGRSLIENSIRNMAMSIGAAFGSGLLGMVGNNFGMAAQAASKMAMSVATIGLVAGFTLYYVLPFLPFIYFFFAVGSWVKSIFEAMVGVPLWALAHLRIDGEGLPGRSAMGGYFLIFEIFLRPIVIVFGLIGGVAVFGAMAVMLNNIFDLVVLNSGGVGPASSGGDAMLTATGGHESTFGRGIVDKFFFTIMYTILLYMMATSSFKMIDAVPENIMRWINTGVSAFNDNKGDPTANLTTYVAYGGFRAAQPVLGGVRQLAEGAGSVIPQAAKMAGPGPE